MEYSLVEPYERKARSIEESLGGLDMIKAGTPTERVVIKMRIHIQLNLSLAVTHTKDRLLN